MSNCRLSRPLPRLELRGEVGIGDFGSIDACLKMGGCDKVTQRQSAGKKGKGAQT